MQSAFIQLLKGHVFESMQTYPALIPMTIMVLFLFIHLIVKFTYGSKILKILFFFTVILIVFNYLYHLIQM